MEPRTNDAQAVGPTSGPLPPGATVFATFEAVTDYFGSRTQQMMLNIRVRDLDAMLARCGNPVDIVVAPRPGSWRRGRPCRRQTPGRT